MCSVNYTDKVYELKHISIILERGVSLGGIRGWGQNFSYVIAQFAARSSARQIKRVLSSKALHVSEKRRWSVESQQHLT